MWSPVNLSLGMNSSRVPPSLHTGHDLMGQIGNVYLTWQLITLYHQAVKKDNLCRI